jgi:RNA polymerase sigma-70 factor (ECF subfamily)
MNDLIGRWVAGDAAAAEELYRDYFSRVKGFILSKGANLNDAEDIAQEALIAGLDGLNAGRKPDRLTHWLLGIAKHVWIRKLEERTDELREIVDPAHRSARSMVIRREMGVLLEKSLSRMSEIDREVLDLLYRAGLSRKEIAERLDLSIDTVHARCDRAHARLRRALSRHFTTVAMNRLEAQAISLEDIRQLRPAFRQAITARHLEDLPEATAAQRLALPEVTFRVRLQSAYEILHCGPKADFSKAREQYLKEKGDKRIGGIR